MKNSDSGYKQNCKGKAGYVRNRKDPVLTDSAEIGRTGKADYCTSSDPGSQICKNYIQRGKLPAA
jgi:hypothetical protein